MKILVVEGAPLIRPALEAAFYEVLEIDRGRRVLEKLDDVAPDAVVIGSEVVGMSGADLAMHIRTHRDHLRTPLILVSGRRSYEDVLDAVHRGVDEYIALPFTGDLLVSKLASALVRKTDPRPMMPSSLPVRNVFLNS